MASWGMTGLIYFKMILESVGQEVYLVRRGNSVEWFPAMGELVELFLKPKTAIERHRATYPRSKLRKYAAVFLGLSVSLLVISEVVRR